MDYTVDIICPVYNGEDYILELDKSLKKQSNVKINSIKYAVTESKDKTEKILEENNIEYIKIKKEEFSHSKTREKIAKTCNADIIVFITQDIIIEKEDWLYNLTSPIANGECSASYSRQISKSKGIEKYTREKNYPENSYIRSKEDLEKIGLRTFFFSDASSAISNEVFKSLNYYDDKNLSISEDMYIAYKLIMNGHKIKYCADSIIIHSHDFTFKQLYKRYYDTGIFFKENSYLDEYGTNKTGGGLAIYIIKRILQEKDFGAFLRFWPDMVARFVGMKAGKHSNKNVVQSENINLGNIVIALFSFIISMVLYYWKSNYASAFILTLTGILLFFLNKREEGYYTNPTGIFSLIWFCAIGLSNLQLHQKQVEWKYETWVCFLITYIAFNIGYIIGKKRKKKLQESKTEKAISKKNNLIFITLLFCASLVAFIIEVCIRGYVPAFSSDMSSYQRFSITGIHYFTVSCALVLPLTYIYYARHKKSITKMEMLYLISINIVSLAIPLLIVSRQLILATFTLTGFAIMKKNKNKEIIILLIILIVGLFTWNFISGFRNQDDAYLRQALSIQKDAPLAASNMQIYMYITMNFDNFNCNVNELSQYYYGTRSIFPAFVFTGVKFIEPFFTDVTTVAKRILPVYNTYPIVATPYFDFGYIGIVIYMLIVGYIAFYVEKLDDDKDIINGLLNALIKYALLFSFFIAYFSNPTWWFYVIILIIGKKFVFKLNNKCQGEK